MAVVYLVDLPLDPADPIAWETTDRVVRDWAARRIRVDMPVEDTVVSADGTRHAAHRTQYGAAGQLDTYETAVIDTNWTWRTTIWLQRTRETVSVRLRLQVVGSGESTSALDRPVARPGIAPALMSSTRVLVDGLPVGRAHRIHVEDVDGLVGLLLDSGRRLPIVAVTHPVHGQHDPAVANGLADKLGGLAHVVDLLDAAATRRLTDQLGVAELGVYDGGIRLYWPGLTTKDYRHAHPLRTRKVIDRDGLDKVTTRIFRELANASVLREDVPRLARELRREAQEADRRQTTEKLVELRRQLDERPTQDSATGNVVDEEWAMAQFDQYEATVQVLTEERDDAVHEADELREHNERLQEELEAHQRNWASMATGRRGRDEGADADGGEGVDEAASSVAEAVRLAEAECDNLVFLPEAHDSADASMFPRPDDVLHDLRCLDQVAGRLFDPAENRTLRQLCPEEGLSNLRPGISSTAAQRFGTDYTRNYDGRSILLREHLASGTGAPNSIMRIYFHLDSDTNKIVVGHVGRKLRDASNP